MQNEQRNTEKIIEFRELSSTNGIILYNQFKKQGLEIITKSLCKFCLA